MCAILAEPNVSVNEAESSRESIEYALANCSTRDFRPGGRFFTIPPDVRETAD
jgi:hypothetical protein